MGSFEHGSAAQTEKQTQMTQMTEPEEESLTLEIPPEDLHGPDTVADAPAMPADSGACAREPEAVRGPATVTEGAAAVLAGHGVATLLLEDGANDCGTAPDMPLTMGAHAEEAAASDLPAPVVEEPSDAADADAAIPTDTVK